MGQRAEEGWIQPEVFIPECRTGGGVPASASIRVTGNR